MVAKSSMRSCIALIIFVLILATFLNAPQDVRSETRQGEVGASAGWSIDNGDESFSQFDVTGAHTLPWHGRWWDTVDVGTRMTATASLLDGGGDTGLIGSLGLEVVFGKASCPLEIRAGVSPALMSRYRYGDENLGGAFQIITHLGVEYRLAEYLRGFTRIQHMSNAGIYDENPGVNMVMVGLRYRF